MIKFKCFLPEVLEEYPITQISKKDFKWIGKAYTYYKNNNDKFKTIRCPGIFSLLEKGWIQKSYQDISIKTNGDKESLIVATPYNQKEGFQGNIIQDYVSCHPPQQMDIFKPMPKHTLKTIIKIQSPWKVSIPKKYYLLVGSVPYNDEDIFTVAPGLLQGDNFLNIQMFWHKLNGEHVIKKGTPLAYYLLIEKKKYEFSLECIK
tara:strand:+ start:1604 stop:2215 length:612 start_codon:yes stop_codon:yes gene_type:complete